MASVIGIGFGGGSYSGYVGTTARLESAPAGTSAHAVAKNVGENSEAGSSLSGSINVQSGTPSLVGGIGNWQEGALANSGVTLWVESPSGVRINSATAPNASGQVVFLEGDNLLSFVVNDPEPGQWTYGVQSASGDLENLQISATTIPTGGIDEMVNTLGEIFGYLSTEDGSMKAAQSQSTRSINWRCGVCKVATYGLALTIACIGAAALTTLSVTSAIVVAVSNLAAWITAPMALAFLVGLATGVVLVVDFILTSLCEWLSVC